MLGMIALGPLVVVGLYQSICKIPTNSKFDFLTIVLSCFGAHYLVLLIYEYLGDFGERYMHFNCGFSSGEAPPCSNYLYELDSFITNWLLFISIFLSVGLQLLLLHNIKRRNIFNKSNQPGTSLR